MILNWAQARKAFLLKAVTTVAEASAAHETEVLLASTRQKQQEVCADLKAKVGALINLPHANLVFTGEFKMKSQCLSEEKLTEAGCHSPVFAGLIELFGAMRGKKAKYNLLAETRMFVKLDLQMVLKMLCLITGKDPCWCFNQLLN